MTKLLFAGSRLDSVITVYGTAYETNGGIDTAYSDAAIYIVSASVRVRFYDPASAPLLSPYASPAGNSVFFHAFTSPGYIGNPSGDLALIFYDSALNPWIQIYYSGQCLYNSGTGISPTWTSLGTPPNIWPSGSTIDVQVTIGEDGNHSLFLIYSNNPATPANPIFYFNQPLLTNMAFIDLVGINGDFASGSWSQLIVTENLSTVGAHVQTCRATGVGTHSDWSGTYTDVNEQITDDTTVNQVTTAGAQQSYPMSNITIPAGYEIAGVFHWMRAKNNGDTPQNIASLIRTEANVDHVSSNVNNLLVAFTGVGARYDVNPDTGVRWTETDWNTPVQLGFVSES